MRIAFVGKGGSGKTTLASLFSLYAKENDSVLAIDADINIHMPSLLGFPPNISQEQHISFPKTAEQIKTYLRSDNELIRDMAHFRKTTPPAHGSKLINAKDHSDPFLKKFSVCYKNICLLVVGTYDTEQIGTSCYHNNLAILENVLTHLIDKDAVVVTDMVAGVDSFASTLHAQFDLMVLSAEPTIQSVEVFEQYKTLAKKAETYEQLIVVGNKIRNDADKEFIASHIPKEKLFGFLEDSEYLRTHNRIGGALNIKELEKENMEVLKTIKDKLDENVVDPDIRLKKIHELHKKYVGQAFITERFGDLTDQIDSSFSFTNT